VWRTASLRRRCRRRKEVRRAGALFGIPGPFDTLQAQGITPLTQGVTSP
jgi:hypothetical protein